MRIAFVTETWEPSVNGVVTRLSATITELTRDGHEVLVVGPRGAPERSCGADFVGVSTVHLPFVYGGQPWGLPTPTVRSALRSFRPDVVHVVNPVFLGIAGVLSARRLGLPLVASYHTNVAHYARYYHLGWLAPVTERLLRWLHGKATLNLATSAAGTAELRRRGIEHVQLWRRGVDLERFNPRRRLASPLPADPPLALYVGRLAQEKSVQRLEPLLAAGSVQLELVGDGPDRERLARRFEGRPVRFLGTLVGEALADAYAAADVFVFPSSTETLGLVLLEALASGLPVVAPDTPASREILEDCPAARVFPPERPELIPELLAELVGESVRPRLAAVARRSAEQWSWEAATKELVGYYEDAIVAETESGRRQRSWHQLVRFLAVGLSNAVIDVGVFNLLLLARPTTSTTTLLLFNTVAVLAAITNSYLWNTRWTFRAERARSRRGRWRQRAGFLTQSVLNVVVNDAVLGTAVTLISLGSFSRTLTNNLAKLLAMFVSSSLSFLVMKFFVFRPWGRKTKKAH